MKKKLLALSMVAASAGLMAQSDGSMKNQSYNQSSCCSECCSNPCYCSNPRPCIDCECYTAPFHNLQCDWGFFLDVEFLYWYARESNIPYAARIEAVSNNDEVGTARNVPCVTTPLLFDAKWDPGVRAGLGWNLGCDGWDLFLNWTYFKNTSRRSSSSPEYEGANPTTNVGEQAILSNLSSIWDGVTTYVSSLSARWVNRFNQIDLVMGRKYWLSRCFVMRPYAGLRGAWTRTHISLNGSDGPKDIGSTIVAFNRQLSVGERNKMWGVGFVGGFEPTFYFTNCFAMYANAGISVLWGKFQQNRSESFYEDNSTGIVRNISCPLSYQYALMSSIIDLGIGLRWEQTWCSDRYRTAFDLGWEHHIWNGHSHRFNGQNAITSGGTEIINHFHLDRSDLGYGGLVIRLKWDF